MEFIGFDITGGKIEYDILASQGPNTTLRKVRSQKHILQILQTYSCICAVMIQHWCKDEQAS